MKWKELHEGLEEATDRCEDVANPSKASSSSSPEGASSMDTLLLVAIAIIAVALVFDFINGFHDAANSIATVVSTQVLSPRVAVVGRVLQLHRGLRLRDARREDDRQRRDRHRAVSSGRSRSSWRALIGAIVWNLITRYFGIPSSSSHALVGGLVGAAIAKASSLAGALDRHPDHRDLHRHRADARPATRRGVDDPCWRGSSAASRRCASTSGSALGSCSRRPSTASATDSTTRRRPWA